MRGRVPVRFMPPRRIGRMRLARVGALLGRRPGRHAALAAVVADVAPVRGGVVDHRLVHVDVVDVGDVDVRDGPVVVEIPAAPVAADVADAEIAESVVDAAVEADLRPPVAFVPAVVAVGPAPPSWGPQQPDGGRDEPCAVDPVVAVRTPGPVARGPDVAGAGRDGLDHVRQGRRGQGDCHSNADGCRCGPRQRQQRGGRQAGGQSERQGAQAGRHAVFRCVPNGLHDPTSLNS